MTPPFQTATPEITELLAMATHRRFTKGSLIVREGDPSSELFFILAGSVTVMMEDSDGHELILSYLGPGDFFGELGFFGGHARRSAYVRARGDCDVALIGYDRFKHLIREQPDLLLQITAQIAARLRATSQKLGHLAFLDVTGRVARTLLDLAHDSQAITHPDGMLVRITREELSRLVNCSPKMTGKVLRNLEEQGLIEAHGKSIVVIGQSITRPWTITDLPGEPEPMLIGSSEHDDS